MLTYGEYVTKCDVLTKWAKSYANGQQEVEDSVYDAVYRELKEYEMYNPDMVLEDSPTRHVIETSDVNTGFAKVKHEVPMISIANSNGISEAEQWVKSVSEKYGVNEVELEYKLDGCGLALTYVGGKLFQAVTRGTDNVGDDVSSNALKIIDVPTSINESDLVEVRGEVLWNFDDFNVINDEILEAGKKAFANPRNGVAGTLKLHDPAEVEHRKIRFMSYIIARGSKSETQTGDVEWLERNGFVVPPHHTVSIADGTEEFVRVAEEMRSKRYDLPYPIDGIVVKVNDKKLHAQMGYTTKCPNFYRAYKFPPEEKDTELIDVESSIGMGGSITPVGVFKPVHLAMTTVQRCSLHNWDLVDYLGLHKGCKVTIRKAGEIIPEIVKCVETGMLKDDYRVLSKKKADIPVYSETHSGLDYYVRPTVCPYCGGELHNQVSDSNGDELVAWVCDNPDCDAQLGNRLSHFGDRTTMNIKGLGPSIIQDLLDAGKIHDFHDIYKLTNDDLVGIGNIREKGAARIISAIDATRSNYLHQLIEGFSIPSVGHQASPVIARCIQNTVGRIDSLCNEQNHAEFVHDALSNGLTSLLITKFLKWVVGHQEIVKYFVDNGIAQKVKEDLRVSNSLEGRVCIMTGTFDKLDRDVFKKMVVENGGTVCSGISKKTNLVLLGHKAGPSKVEAIDKLKAAGCHITVYTNDTLDEFLELVGETTK